MSNKLQSFTKDLFKDKHGKPVIVQQPNLPLILFILFTFLGLIFNSGSLSYLFKVTAFGSIFTWAWLEIFDGSSHFRRLLGIVVLIFVVMSAIEYLRLAIPTVSN